MQNDYLEKLKDPRWQKKRLEILERDGWRCKSCGSSECTLDVHSLFCFKGRDPWEINDGFLIALCDDCHLPGKEGHEDVGMGEVIVEEIGLLLRSIWGSGYDAADVLEITEAVCVAKKPKTGQLWKMRISAKYK